MAPVVLALDRSTEWDVEKEKSARDDALTDATVKTPRAGVLSMLLLFVRALHRTKRERNAAVRSPKTRATVAFKLSS